MPRTPKRRPADDPPPFEPVDCPHCGASTGPENEKRYCSRCDRDGCAGCIPDGPGVVCPECQEDEDKE